MISVLETKDGLLRVEEISKSEKSHLPAGQAMACYAITPSRACAKTSQPAKSNEKSLPPLLTRVPIIFLIEP
jgi:hypothetical protein